MRRELRVVLLLIGAALATSVRATQGVRLDLGEMVDRADDVVLAQAVGNRVVTDPETRFHYTITRFVVEDRVKGSLAEGGELELRLIGGRAPGSYYATVVPGIPRFRAQERVVLFTKRGLDGRQILLGLDGAIRLADGPRGPVVLSPPVERVDGPRRLHVGATNTDTKKTAGGALRLSEFMDRVRTLTQSHGEDAP